MHGIRVRWSAAGVEIDGPRSDAATVVTDVKVDDVVGAVYGPVDDLEARTIVMSLAAGDDPRGADVPWLAIAHSPSRGLAAAASMMLPSGLFWSQEARVVTVASDPVAACPSGRTEVNAEFVRDFSLGTSNPKATAFVGVHRQTAGSSVQFARPDAIPNVVEWCGPSQWGEPTLSGDAAIATYREVFDGVVADLARRSGTVVTTVSGGLDSTFIAASLALNGVPGSTVRGLTYAPLPEADVDADADETALARLMANQYPHALTIENVMNTKQIRPLDAAIEMSRRSGAPTFNAVNQPWLTQMREIAASDGAALWFVGANGNAAFSYHHPYAKSRSLLSRLLRTNTTDDMNRAGYLKWLARSVTGLPAAGNPAAMEGVLMADPFASRAVIEVAASITPAEWVRGDERRGFARRAASGRVPDEIRLRTGRGRQGRDAWYVIRNDRDAYLDRVRSVRNVAGLEHVEMSELEKTVASWPWGQVLGPNWREQVSVDRILGIAQFAGVWPPHEGGVASSREG